MNHMKELVEQVSSWAGVSVQPHRFGGKEFQFGSAEVGHVHTGGIVDIPFPRPIRDALLEEHLAEEHHWVPSSGWITFRVKNENDLEHALWLMRLSYLRYTLKTAQNADTVLEEEAEQLRLTPRFRLLLEPFVRRSAKAATAQPLPT
jgi:hypothetical protein